MAAGEEDLVPSLARTNPIDCLLGETERASSPRGFLYGLAGPIDCLSDCFHKISGATVGYNQPLIGEPLDDEVFIATDDRYRALGVFALLEPEKNANEDVIYHKYKIREGFSQTCDKPYDDDEPAPLSHEEGL